MAIRNSTAHEGAESTVAVTGPSTFLNLALVAFALLGLELVLLILEPLIPTTAGTIEAALVHWIITIVLWAGGSAALVVWALRHTDFTLAADVRARGATARWLGIGILVLVTLFAQWALRGGVLPPNAEFAALTDRFGAAGALAWLVQVVYYIAELGVMALIIAFGQRAGDAWFGRGWIPWGGVTLSLTWGLVHFLTQDAATGVYGIVLSLVMGTVYVLTGRSLVVAVPILLVLFII